MNSHEHVYYIPICTIQINSLLRNLVQYQITQHPETWRRDYISFPCTPYQKFLIGLNIDETDPCTAISTVHLRSPMSTLSLNIDNRRYLLSSPTSTATYSAPDKAVLLHGLLSYFAYHGYSRRPVSFRPPALTKLMESWQHKAYKSPNHIGRQ